MFAVRNLPVKCDFLSIFTYYKKELNFLFKKENYEFTATSCCQVSNSQYCSAVMMRDKSRSKSDDGAECVPPFNKSSVCTRIYRRGNKNK